MYINPIKPTKIVIGINILSFIHSNPIDAIQSKEVIYEVDRV